MPILIKIKYMEKVVLEQIAEFIFPTSSTPARTQYQTVKSG
jgi:hypothetical protein